MLSLFPLSLFHSSPLLSLPLFPLFPLSPLFLPLSLLATDGWGKPPVDEQGRPLYGDDVFDQSQGGDHGDVWKKFNKTKWGELQINLEEDEEDEEDEEEQQAAAEA